MTKPDPIRRKAIEIVDTIRRHYKRDAVDVVEASLRLVDHDGFMRGHRIGEGKAMTEAFGNDGSEREEAA